MADQQTHVRNLAYGQLGRATYTTKNHEWTFTRELGESRTGDYQAQPLSFHCFRQISETEVCFADEVGRKRTSDNNPNKTYGNGRPYPQALPQVAAAASLLAHHMGTWRNENVGEQNAASTDLLIFGAAVRLSHARAERNLSVPITAFVTGPTCNTLRIAYIQSRTARLSSNSYHDIPVQLPAISTDTFADWNSPDQPIRQIICPSAECMVQTWLAARQDSATTIFHPLLNEPNPYSQGGTRVFQQLDANPILTLPVSRTGGYSHADIAFHPEDAHQLALVDTHGHWSIWKVTDSKKLHGRPRFSATLVQHGRLHSWTDRYKPSSPRPHHDGWHAVRWIKTATQIYRLAVCDRRTMIVFDTAGGPAITPQLRLGSGRDGQWILGVKAFRRCQGLLILTTNSILWLSAPEPHTPSRQVKPIIEVEYSMIHHRAPSDVTLRASVFEDSKEQIILVYSAQNNVVTAFRVALQPNNTQSMSHLDPVSFQIDGHLQASSGKPLSLLQLDLQEVEYRVKDDTKPSARLFKLFFVDAELSIHETLLQHIDEVEKDVTSLQLIRLPLFKRPRKSAAVIVDEDLADFIADDNEIEEQVKTLSVPAHHTRPSQAELQDIRASWSVDWHSVYEALAGPSLTSKRRVTTRNTSSLGQTRFSTAAESISKTLSNPDDVGTGVKLLLELSPWKGPTTIDEVTDDAEIYKAMQEKIVQNDQNQLIPLWRAHQTTNENEDSSLRSAVSSIYSQLLAEFHSPLPLDFPARIRIAKEKIIRQVTADLALSSISLRLRPQPTDTEAPSKNTQASPQLPTPRSSQSNQSPTPSSNILSSAYARLSTYTTISASHPSLPAPSPSLSRLLSHLPPPPTTTTPFPHPSTYSYTASRLTESGAAAPPPSPSQTLAQARLQRRRQKQQDLFESSQRERMAPPTIAVSSQPDPTSPLATTRALPFRSSPQAGAVRGPSRPVPGVASSSQALGEGGKAAGPSSSSQQQQQPGPTNVLQTEFSRLRREAESRQAPNSPGFGFGPGFTPSQGQSSRKGKRRAGF